MTDTTEPNSARKATVYLAVEIDGVENAWDATVLVESNPHMTALSLMDTFTEQAQRWVRRVSEIEARLDDNTEAENQ